MDVVAHTLWTNAVFYAKFAHDRRQRYWAAFFGVAPDLVAFGPAFVVMVADRVLRNVTLSNYMAAYASPTGVYAFAVQTYNYTHSLVIALGIFIAVSLALSLKAKRVAAYWPLLGWSLHVVIDIFTHPDFFRTPFLFPLSDYKNYHAISWAHPIFMAVNYACLALAYILIWRWQKRQRQKPSNAQAQ